jgi:magnesium transporter
VRRTEQNWFVEGIIMQSARLLALSFLKDHADEAAAVLETRPPLEVAALLEEESPELVGTLLQRMTASSAAACLGKLPAQRAAAVCEVLAPNTLAALLRLMDPAAQSTVLRGIRRAVRGRVERVLRYPEGTAGALMDPRLPPFPQDITVENAIARMRKGHQGNCYYLYMVDREQRLVGVATVRELLLANRRDQLSVVMHSPVERLPANAVRHVVLSHPAWRLYHALPVVDEGGQYVGVIQYETLRRLESESSPGSGPAGAMETAMRLGELVWVGFAGVFAGLAGPPESTPGPTTAGGRN